MSDEKKGGIFTVYDCASIIIGGVILILGALLFDMEEPYRALQIMFGSAAIVFGAAMMPRKPG
ncbi:MAG: hypothetical protein ACK4Z6_01195 [Candidatus Methylomirabilales bacterium]